MTRKEVWRCADQGQSSGEWAEAATEEDESMLSSQCERDTGVVGKTGTRRRRALLNRGRSEYSRTLNLTSTSLPAHAPPDHLTNTPVTKGKAAQSVSLCSSTLSHFPAVSSIRMVSCESLHPPTKYGHPRAV